MTTPDPETTRRAVVRTGGSIVTDYPVSGDNERRARERWAIPHEAMPVLGQLWQRVEESGRGLEVIGNWLAWVEPDCGRCSPYGCPPGSHAEPIRELTWRAA